MADENLRERYGHRCKRTVLHTLARLKIRKAQARLLELAARTEPNADLAGRLIVCWPNAAKQSLKIDQALRR